MGVHGDSNLTPALSLMFLTWDVACIGPLPGDTILLHVLPLCLDLFTAVPAGETRGSSP